MVSRTGGGQSARPQGRQPCPAPRRPGRAAGGRPSLPWWHSAGGRRRPNSPAAGGSLPGPRRETRTASAGRHMEERSPEKVLVRSPGTSLSAPESAGVSVRSVHHRHPPETPPRVSGRPENNQTTTGMHQTATRQRAGREVAAVGPAGCSSDRHHAPVPSPSPASCKSKPGRNDRKACYSCRRTEHRLHPVRHWPVARAYVCVPVQTGVYGPGVRPLRLVCSLRRLEVRAVGGDPQLAGAVQVGEHRGDLYGNRTSS